MKQRDPIPSSDSIEELAIFWQSHDLADYDDVLVEVPGPVFVRKPTVNVRLKSGEAKSLEKMASAKGLSPAELVHQWVAEKITRHKNAKRRRA